jgi:hypothetical protein
MKPVTQTIFNAVRGNCFAACLASLLEVEIDQVPNIHDMDGDDWFYPLNRWLKENHSLVLLMVEATAYAHKVWFPDGVPFIASCDGSAGVRHAVVMEYQGMEAKILHYPFPGSGVVESGPIFMYFLVKP